MRTEKKKINRRTFLKAAGIGSASLAVSTGLAGDVLAAEVEKKTSSKEMPTRILGKTGVPVSILGMGGSVDTSGYLVLLRLALNMGVNYWDSANSYGNGRNEEVIGQFYSKYPEDRKKVFQVTKASRVTEPKGLNEQLSLSLERMKTNYIDLYLMHGLQDPGVLTPEIKSWVEQKKKEGKIKFFGFSCHGGMARMFMHASTLGWIDAVMGTYNYKLINDDDMKKSIAACAKANIGIIAMKTQGQSIGMPVNMPEGQEGRQSGSGMQPQGQGGQEQGPPPGMQDQGASKEPEDLSAMSHFIEKGYTLEQAKLKAIWEDKRITVCLSEMTSMTMLKDNVAAAVDGVKLSDGDREMLNRLAQFNRNLYCQGCMRCESVMGAESRIPDVLRYMMYFNSYGKTDDARRLFKELPDSVRNSLALRDYSPAERACPNKIEIGKAMRKAFTMLG